MTHRRWWIWVVVFLLVVGCSGESSPVALTSSGPGSTTTVTVASDPTTTTTFAPGIPDAVDYLAEAVDVVEGMAVFADEINWAERRAMAFDAGRVAEYPHQLHGFIREMLADLNDRHSRFATPSAVDGMRDGSEATFAQVELIDDRIGYVRMEGFSGIDSQSLDYATTLQSDIGMVAPNTCGWIIDLRSNTGGNMWPMILGLGPLLEMAGEELVDARPGVLGFFIDAQGDWMPWRYHDGSAWIGDSPILTVDDPIHLDRPDPPTAVLVSGTTASAGEFILISLISQPATRTFGWPTFGVPSGNEGFPLSDGAAMFITAATAAGRDGRHYDPLTSIEPDIETGGTKSAMDWLLDQPPCG